MYWLLIAALLAQAAPTWSGQWVGPMSADFDALQKRGAIPTTVELEQSGTTISGSWRTLKPNNLSGSITGTIQKDGTAKLTILFYTDGDLDGGAVLPERCKAEGAFTGQLTVAGMIALSAKNLKADASPDRNCGPWPHDLQWLLQRH